MALAARSVTSSFLSDPGSDLDPMFPSHHHQRNVAPMPNTTSQQTTPHTHLRPLEPTSSSLLPSVNFPLPPRRLRPGDVFVSSEPQSIPITHNNNTNNTNTNTTDSPFVVAIGEGHGTTDSPNRQAGRAEIQQSTGYSSLQLRKLHLKNPSLSLDNTSSQRELDPSSTSNTSSSHLRNASNGTPPIIAPSSSIPESSSLPQGESTKSNNNTKQEPPPRPPRSNSILSFPAVDEPSFPNPTAHQVIKNSMTFVIRPPEAALQNSQVQQVRLLSSSSGRLDPSQPSDTSSRNHGGEQALHFQQAANHSLVPPHRPFLKHSRSHSVESRPEFHSHFQASPHFSTFSPPNAQLNQDSSPSLSTTRIKFAALPDKSTNQIGTSQKENPGSLVGQSVDEKLPTRRKTGWKPRWLTHTSKTSAGSNQLRPKPSISLPLHDTFVVTDSGTIKRPNHSVGNSPSKTERSNSAQENKTYITQPLSLAPSSSSVWNTVHSRPRSRSLNGPRLSLQKIMESAGSSPKLQQRHPLLPQQPWNDNIPANSPTHSPLLPYRSSIAKPRAPAEKLEPQEPISHPRSQPPPQPPSSRTPRKFRSSVAAHEQSLSYSKLLSDLDPTSPARPPQAQLVPRPHTSSGTAAATTPTKSLHTHDPTQKSSCMTEQHSVETVHVKPARKEIRFRNTLELIPDPIYLMGSFHEGSIKHASSSTNPNLPQQQQPLQGSRAMESGISVSDAHHHHQRSSVVEKLKSPRSPPHKTTSSPDEDIHPLNKVGGSLPKRFSRLRSHSKSSNNTLQHQDSKIMMMNGHVMGSDKRKPGEVEEEEEDLSTQLAARKLAPKVNLTFVDLDRHIGSRFSVNTLFKEVQKSLAFVDTPDNNSEYKLPRSSSDSDPSARDMNQPANTMKSTQPPPHRAPLRKASDSSSSKGDDTPSIPTTLTTVEQNSPIIKPLVLTRGGEVGQATTSPEVKVVQLEEGLQMMFQMVVPPMSSVTHSVTMSPSMEHKISLCSGEDVSSLQAERCSLAYTHANSLTNGPPDHSGQTKEEAGDEAIVSGTDPAHLLEISQRLGALQKNIDVGAGGGETVRSSPLRADQLQDNRMNSELVGNVATKEVKKQRIEKWLHSISVVEMPNPSVGIASSSPGPSLPVIKVTESASNRAVISSVPHEGPQPQEGIGRLTPPDFIQPDQKPQSLHNHDVSAVNEECPESPIDRYSPHTLMNETKITPSPPPPPSPSPQQHTSTTPHMNQSHDNQKLLVVKQVEDLDVKSSALPPSPRLNQTNLQQVKPKGLDVKSTLPPSPKPL